MFCPNCGRENDNNAYKCVNCGTVLQQAQQPPSQQPVGTFSSGGPMIAAANVPNYLVQSILATIFCCLPAGIAAIVYAAQVNGKLAAGDYSGAVDSSNKAKMWSWIAFGGGLAIIVLYAILFMAGVANLGNTPTGDFR